jgi:hypothetical protein
VPTQREELERQAAAEAAGLRDLIPPLTLTAGAFAALQALEAYTRGSLADLSEWHREMFLAYREDLAALFRRYSRPGRQTDPDRAPPDVWALEALQDRVPRDLAESFAELSEALYVEDTDAMEEWLDAALTEGHQRELWLLAMAGLDIDDYREGTTLPDTEEDRAILLLTLGLFGASWMARRAAWRDDVTRRVGAWTEAAIVGGMTLDDTVAGFDRITDSFTGRVEGLVENEMLRTFDAGGDIALTAAQEDYAITEVWVTRADRLVCGICAPRHMKVTPLKPVTDSHPGCRCRKVPVPADFEYTDVAYDQLFRSAFGDT